MCYFQWKSFPISLGCLQLIWYFFIIPENYRKNWYSVHFERVPDKNFILGLFFFTEILYQIPQNSVEQINNRYSFKHDHTMVHVPFKQTQFISSNQTYVRKQQEFKYKVKLNTQKTDHRCITSHKIEKRPIWSS